MGTRNLEIDRLRAVAVSITLYAHLDFIMLGAGDWYTASKSFVSGTVGVTLFFAISGYLISGALIPDLDASTGKRWVLASFWIRRSTRILPMALVWIAVPLLLSATLNSRSIFGSFEHNIDGAIAAALFYYNAFAHFGYNKSTFGVYWSLSLEEQFYIIFPFFLLAIRGTTTRIVAIAAIAVLPFWVGGFAVQGMCFGAILYLAMANKRRTAPTQAVPRWLGIAVPLCLTGALAMLPPIGNRYVPEWMMAQATALISVVLVWLAAQDRGFILPLGPEIDAVVDWIGTRSFGLYLIHLPAFMFAGELTWRLQTFDDPWGRGAIALVVMLVATEVSYRFVEVPVRSWGRSMAEKVAFRSVEPVASNGPGALIAR
jgi:peptidoglycan/LPS O-acetylase OafA/YrhL